MAKKKEVPEWEAALLNMKDLSDTVRLQCDQYQLKVTNVLRGRKMVLMYYVNGEFKGEFLDKNNPIGQKFGMPVFDKSKKTVEMIKLLNGKNRKKATEEIKAFQSKVVMFNYCWFAPKDLIKKLNCTCYKVELIEVQSLYRDVVNFPF